MIYRLVSDITPDTPMGKDHVVYPRAIIERMRDLLNEEPCRVLVTVEAHTDSCEVGPYERRMSTGVIGAKEGSVVTMVSKMDQLYLEKSR